MIKLYFHFLDDHQTIWRWISYWRYCSKSITVVNKAWHLLFTSLEIIYKIFCWHTNSWLNLSHHLMLNSLKRNNGKGRCCSCFLITFHVRINSNLFLFHYLFLENSASNGGTNSIMSTKDFVNNFKVRIIKFKWSSKFFLRTNSGIISNFEKQISSFISNYNWFRTISSKAYSNPQIVWQSSRKWRNWR